MADDLQNEFSRRKGGIGRAVFAKRACPRPHVQRRNGHGPDSASRGRHSKRTPARPLGFRGPVRVRSFYEGKPSAGCPVSGVARVQGWTSLAPCGLQNELRRPVARVDAPTFLDRPDNPRWVTPNNILIIVRYSHNVRERSITRVRAQFERQYTRGIGVCQGPAQGEMLSGVCVLDAPKTACSERETRSDCKKFKSAVRGKNRGANLNGPESGAARQYNTKRRRRCLCCTVL